MLICCTSVQQSTCIILAILQLHLALSYIVYSLGKVGCPSKLNAGMLFKHSKRDCKVENEFTVHVSKNCQNF